MKIICAKNDNQANHISDELICENINLYYGKIIVTFFNEKHIDYTYDFYRLVEDDYKLKEL
jgi:hypothetical protein